MKEEVVISVRMSGALQAERTMGRLNKNVDATRIGEKNLRKETDSLGRAMDRSSSKINKTNRSVDKLRRSVDKTSASSRRFSGLISGAISLSTIAMITKYADAYTLLQKQLTLVTKNTSEMSGVLSELFQISNRTSSQIEASTELYVSLARATRDLNVPSKEMLSTTENILKLVNASGASSSSSAAALLQLSQAFNMGALRGQEFRSVLSQTPTLLQAIEEYLKKENLYPGVKIMKLAEEGKLTLDLMRKVYQDAELINKLAGETDPKTVAQGFQNIKNSLKLLSGRIVQDTGLLKKFIDMLKLLADKLLLFAEDKQAVSIGGFIAIAGAISGIILIAKPLIGVLGAIAGALGAIGAGISLPFVAAAGAIGVAGAAIYKNFDKVKAYVKDTAADIKAYFEPAFETYVKPTYDKIATYLEPAYNKITTYVGYGFEKIKGYLGFAKDTTEEIVEDMEKIEKKKILIDKPAELLKVTPDMRPERKLPETLYERFFKQIRTQTEMTGTIIENTFSAAGSALTQFVKQGKVNIRSFFAEIFLNISRLFLQQALLKGITGFLGGGGIGSAASGIFSLFGGSGGTSAPSAAPSGGIGSSLSAAAGALGNFAGSGLGTAAIAGVGGAAAGYFAGRGGGGAGAADGINIRIVNVVKEEDAEFSTAPATERVILNIISRNADSVRQIIGG